MPYVNERWLGGMLTNFETISKRVAQDAGVPSACATPASSRPMPKKEALLIGRELEKLERNLGGIRNMEKLPDAVFVLDTKKEHIAVTEANKLGIPVVAVVDTNCDPDVIQYVIPGNDDAIRSGTLMCRVIADAVEEGRFIASRSAAAAPAPRRRRAAPRRRPRSPPQQAEARRQAAARRRRSARPASPPPQAAADAAAERRGRSRAAEAAAAGRARAAEAAGRRAARRDRRGRRRASPTPRRPAAADARPPTDRRPPRSTAAMAEFTAKDVQALRQATGAGMMDAKKALEENDGDLEAASQVAPREGPGQGGRAASDRENTQGAVAVVVDGNVGAIVELKCETDFVAKSDEFIALVQEHRRRSSLAEGEDARRRAQGRRIDDLKVTLKENIELGRVVRFEAADGNVLDTYLHLPGRPRRQRRARRARRRHARSWPTRSPCTSPSPSPTYLQPRRGPRRPTSTRSAQTLESITRPRASPSRRRRRSSRAGSTAGSRTGCCSSRRSSRTRSRRSPQLLGDATIVRFAQVVDRRLRRRLDRRAASRAGRRVVLKLSGEAFAGEAGYGIDGDVVGSSPTRSSRSAATSASTSPSSSAAATSGGA